MNASSLFQRMVDGFLAAALYSLIPRKLRRRSIEHNSAVAADSHPDTRTGQQGWRRRKGILSAARSLCGGSLFRLVSRSGFGASEANWSCTCFALLYSFLDTMGGMRKSRRDIRRTWLPTKYKNYLTFDTVLLILHCSTHHDILLIQTRINVRTQFSTSSTSTGDRCLELLGRTANWSWPYKSRAFSLLGLFSSAELLARQPRNGRRPQLTRSASQRLSFGLEHHPCFNLFSTAYVSPIPMYSRTRHPHCRMG